MTKRQKKRKRLRAKAHCESKRLYNKEHPKEVETRRKNQKVESNVREKKRKKVKVNKEKREAKRRSRNGNKSPNLREINMWGIVVPIYVTPEKLKMFRKGDKDGKS